MSEIKTKNYFERGILLISLANTSGFIYYLFFLHANGYLPPPFFFDGSNTFMDLFNPMYWVYDDGRYTDWKSVYPPLSFIVLKLLNVFFLGSTDGDPEFLRENSPILIAGYCFIYLVLPVFILRTKIWIRYTLRQKLLIYFAIIFSTPMLFALERGNLIIFCPIILAFVLSKGLVRCLSIAVLINFKPYFVLLTFFYLIRRRWKWLALCIVFSGLICLESGLLVDKNFLQFITNMFEFSNASIFSLREVMVMPSSISAFSYVFRNPDAEMFASTLLGYGIPISADGIESVKWLVILSSFAILVIKAPLTKDSEIILVLSVVITNLSNNVGGYSLIFYIPLIPVFITMKYKKTYVTILSLMSVPLDFISLLGYYAGEGYSFISNSYVRINWTLGLGSVVRPIVNIVLLAAIIYELAKRKANKTSHKSIAFRIVDCKTHDAALGHKRAL